MAKNSYDSLPDDEEREVFKLPEFMSQMVAKGLLGNKTKQGFFKKTEGREAGDLLLSTTATGEYKPRSAAKFASVEAGKGIDDPGQRLRTVLGGKDKGAELAWRNLRDTLIYAFNRIPEIADDVVNVDNAMRWGFNWELGPFEMFDAIGVAEFVKRAEADGVAVPAAAARASSRSTLSRTAAQADCDPATRRLAATCRVPTGQRRPRLLLKKAGKVVEKNAGCLGPRSRRRRLRPRVPHQDERHRRRHPGHDPQGRASGPRPRGRRW